ncbi:hypothetical protein [Stygiobacter electus]|uniref:Outer membrane protein beta-barrel domain-containing protein n=1 Tax=Stygiobacter electus TaxID=3032292 RepID=A0AAE3NXC7_9BACT|nr:hypothetical protein [Stygiobacter electus]MDF1612701.1 hypothetical protein [Stygiobacter electus]
MKRIHKIIFLFSIISFTNSSIVFGQNDNIKTNNFYLELGGNNYYYSINYEKIIFLSFSPRIGGSIVPHGESSHTYGNYISIKINLLLMLNYSFYLSTNHAIEVGVGYADLLNRERIYLTFTLGYRYIPQNSKMVYKLSFTPIFNKSIVHNQLWAGFGIGFNY